MKESRPIMTSSTSDGQDRRYRLAWWTLVLALIGGGILRSIWIEDMEWKADERWSYRMSQEVGRTRPWPWVGMPTSLGFPNPGLSAWIFVPIARVSQTRRRRWLAPLCWLNMIGLIGFAAAVRAYLPIREQRALDLGAGAPGGQSLRDPPVEEDLAAIALDALAACCSGSAIGTVTRAEEPSCGDWSVP